MPNSMKELMVKELVEKYRPAAAMVAIGYSGIPAEEATALRKELRAKRVELRVVKNSLARIALDQLGRRDFGAFLDGQVAVISSTDPVAASKAAVEIERSKKLPLKGGWTEGRVLSAEEVKRLAEMPSREVLFAQIARAIIAPAARLCGMLNAPGASLVRAIKAWNDKREGSAASGGAGPA